MTSLEENTITRALEAAILAQTKSFQDDHKPVLRLAKIGFGSLLAVAVPLGLALMTFSADVGAAKERMSTHEAKIGAIELNLSLRGKTDLRVAEEISRMTAEIRALRDQIAALHHQQSGSRHGL